MFGKQWLYSATLTTAIGFAISASAGDPDQMPKPDEMSSRSVVATTVNYSVPDIKLVRDDGKPVSLPAEMNDGRVVVLNFIFTTCSSFCPLSSQTFGEFQTELGSDRKHVHLMSISIDPEQDTPARLREYAHKFGAGPGWQHYTGTLAASLPSGRSTRRACLKARGRSGANWRPCPHTAASKDSSGSMSCSMSISSNSHVWRRLAGTLAMSPPDTTTSRARRRPSAPNVPRARRFPPLPPHR